MPILGIYASANQGQYIQYGSFESIATVTVGAGGSSTITFSSIPQTYKHLQLRMLVRNTVAGNGAEAILAKFNSDTGNNYSRHSLQGNGSTVSANGASSQGALIVGISSEGGEISFDANIADILDYTSTNKNKTIRALFGQDTNNVGYGTVGIYSGLWFNTPAAITRIDLTSSGGNFDQNSHFALYGIK